LASGSSASLSGSSFCSRSSPTGYEQHPFFETTPESGRNTGMNRVIYIVGLVVVVMIILSFIGLR
jgi:hypothetical protein